MYNYTRINAPEGTNVSYSIIIKSLWRGY